MTSSGSRQLHAGTAFVVLGLASLATMAADVQAGKAIAQAQCISCHEADDWEGESAASLESLIRDIVAGKVKHREPLQLTPEEAADIAAYWGESSRKANKRR